MIAGQGHKAQAVPLGLQDGPPALVARKRQKGGEEVCREEGRMAFAPPAVVPRQIAPGSVAACASTSDRSSAVRPGMSAGRIIAPDVPGGRARSPALRDEAMPSAASFATVVPTGRPSSAARRAGRSGGSTTITGAPVASAARAVRRRRGWPSTGSVSLSSGAIRDEAPAARIRIQGLDMGLANSFEGICKSFRKDLRGARCCAAPRQPRMRPPSSHRGAR